MNLKALQSDPVAFRAALMIDTDAGPKPFAERMDPWQRADFEALDNGWRRAAGQSVEGDVCCQRAWLERGRGHSKTSDIACMIAWLLFASRKRLSCIAAAADQDQARLIRDSVARLLHVNPWLNSVLEIQVNRVVNKRTESTLEIISSDAKTSYGILCDAIICDEVVHWRNRDLWDSLLSSAAKRSTCMLVCITNAGIEGDWYWDTREAIRTDPSQRWYFSRLDGPVASWISPEMLAEQKRLLPPMAFERLWLNRFCSSGGDALSGPVIDAAFRPDATPHTTAQNGFTYVAGLDLGVSRDNSALCILGVRRAHAGHGQVHLAAHQLWRPTKGNKVNLQDVEDWLVTAHDRFAFRQINVDPWNAAHMMSRLQSLGLGRIASATDRRVGLPVVEIPPTGSNLQKMASTLIEGFNDFRVELYPCPELRRDLQRLRVEERSYGFRLTSPRDEHGHGDLASAFSLALLAASTLAAKPIPFVGPMFSEVSDFFDTGGSPLQQASQRIARENMLRERENAEMDFDDNNEGPWIELMQKFGRR